MKIVFLEDSENDVILVRRAMPQDWELITVRTKADFLSALNQPQIDIVLLDMSVPEYDGRDAMRDAQRRLPAVPVIILSGSVSDALMAELIRAGATDAIAKDRMARLILAIERAARESLLMGKALRNQRVENISGMAGGICHDLNNVLAPVLMVLGMLRDDVSERRRPLLDKAIGLIQRGSEMVQQILAFAKGIEGTRMLVHPAQLVQQVCSLLRETFPKNIEIRDWVVGSGSPVTGNPTQLYQLLVNLCVNARDAMPGGGCLTMIVDWPTNRGSLCRVQVKDTGPGIPEDLMAKVFLPFFTTKTDGTGLGLSMASEIAKAHGGFIELAAVRDGPNTGTTFSIFLPIALIDTAAPANGVKPASEIVPGNGETIMIVDDEESILSITRDILEKYNYRVLSARNAIAGLEIFTGHERAAIRLVITDHQMPLMDGHEFIERIKRLSPELKCIGVSGADAANIAKADYHLRKPYQLEQFMATVRKALDAA